MNEITREEMIAWLENPITQGFNNAIKLARDIAEDQAFNATLENYKSSCLHEDRSSELFSYCRLEVLNSILMDDFHPLYENLKEIENTPALSDSEDLPKNDAIEEFIIKINESIKYVNKGK